MFVLGKIEKKCKENKIEKKKKKEWKKTKNKFKVNKLYLYITSNSLCVL